MALRNETLEWICERLAPLGQIRARRMFGGWGIYCDGFFFALMADEVLYLKADALNRAQFEAAGLAPFCYAMRDGRVTRLSYYPLPDAALDDEQALREWARLGLAAALRAAQAKAPRRQGASARR